MSLPKELNLGSNKPMAASSRPQILRFRSDNSSYTVTNTGGDTIRIEIPTNRQGHYIFPQESFLEFKIRTNMTFDVAANGDLYSYLDGCGWSPFSRLRVLQGSTVLEDCLYVNRLWTALYDVQVNEAERRQDTINKGVLDPTGAGLPSVFSSGLFGAQLQLAAGAANPAAADGPTLDINFCLPSALFGSLSSKALPISLLGASSLYIELELAPLNVAIVSRKTANANVGTVNNYTLSDIYYNAKTAILPQEVENALLSSTGGIINLPAVAYKCELKTIPANSTAFNDKFSFQYSSIKNFLFFLQNSTTANGGITKRSVTCRTKANISEYYLNINGEVYPSQSIVGSARQYTELQRAFDGLTDTNFGGIISSVNYNNNTNATADEIINTVNDATWLSLSIQKRWLGGIDLDRFNRSSDVLMSGTSTIGQMLSLVATFSVGLVEQTNLYAAVMYDVLYHIENGQMTAKF